MENEGLFFEYWLQGKLYGVIEIQPEFTKRGYLKLWHSLVIQSAMNNEHPDGMKVNYVKIFHGNPNL
jgi:hypothetical protein